MATQLKISNDEEAMNHLFTKLKYDLAIKLWDKLIPILNECKEKVTFSVGKQQRSYPANLVKALSKIKSCHIVVKGDYSMQELTNVFEILMNLSGYKCSGLTQDYDDWKSISSLVNMTELASKFGMEEVETFLKRVPELLTEHNKNTYRMEMKRREELKASVPPVETASPGSNTYSCRSLSTSDETKDQQLGGKILYRSKKSKRDEDSD